MLGAPKYTVNRHAATHGRELLPWRREARQSTAAQRGPPPPLLVCLFICRCDDGVGMGMGESGGGIEAQARCQDPAASIPLRWRSRGGEDRGRSRAARGGGHGHGPCYLAKELCTSLSLCGTDGSRIRCGPPPHDSSGHGAPPNSRPQIWREPGWPSSPPADGDAKNLRSGVDALMASSTPACSSTPTPSSYALVPASTSWS
jgi:hypothetical protein